MNIDELLNQRENTPGSLTAEMYNYLQDNISKFRLPQLKRVLNTGKDDALRALAREELLTRAALNPHWTTVPTFLLVILTIVLNIFPVYVTLKSWSKSSSVIDNNLNEQPPSDETVRKYINNQDRIKEIIRGKQKKNSEERNVKNVRLTQLSPELTLFPIRVVYASGQRVEFFFYRDDYNEWHSIYDFSNEPAK